MRTQRLSKIGYVSQCASRNWKMIKYLSDGEIITSDDFVQIVEIFLR